jgi:hypothetical protein
MTLSDKLEVQNRLINCYSTLVRILERDRKALGYHTRSEDEQKILQAEIERLNKKLK